MLVSLEKKEVAQHQMRQCTTTQCCDFFVLFFFCIFSYLCNLSWHRQRNVECECRDLCFTFHFVVSTELVALVGPINLISTNQKLHIFWIKCYFICVACVRCDCDRNRKYFLLFFSSIISFAAVDSHMHTHCGWFYVPTSNYQQQLLLLKHNISFNEMTFTRNDNRNKHKLCNCTNKLSTAIGIEHECGKRKKKNKNVKWNHARGELRLLFVRSWSVDNAFASDIISNLVETK